MDYSKKTCKELITICKEKSIKGYSGKKKDEIILLLSPLVHVTTLVTMEIDKGHQTMLTCIGNKRKHVSLDNNEMQLFLKYIGKKTIPKGYWKKNNRLILENIKIWIKWFEIHKNIRSLEDWYLINGTMINKSGSGFFTSKAENSFNESIIILLKAIYPDYDWKEYKFNQTTQGWWSKKENRLLWLEDFRKLKNLDNLDDFYNIKVDDLKDQKGCGWITYYGESLINMLKDLYPEHVWYEWLFIGQVPKNFWKYQINRLSFMKWLSIELNCHSAEEWYDIPCSTISIYGGGLYVHYYGNSYAKMIIELNPHLSFDKRKFSRHKTEAILDKYLKKRYINMSWTYKVEWCKRKNYLPFDFCIEELKLIIELDGLQHFVHVPRFNNDPNKNQLDDVFKMTTAIEKGYRVIRLLQKDVLKNDEKWLDEYLKPQLTVEGDSVVYICPNNPNIYDSHKELMKLAY